MAFDFFLGGHFHCEDMPPESFAKGNHTSKEEGRGTRTGQEPQKVRFRGPKESRRKLCAPSFSERRSLCLLNSAFPMQLQICLLLQFPTLPPVLPLAEEDLSIAIPTLMVLVDSLHTLSQEGSN